jgi:hypothetical protein
MSALLEPGRTYFVMSFEDPNLTRPLIETYEFPRKEAPNDNGASGGSNYVFRIVGSDDELALTEAKIWQALDVNALILELTRFRDGQIK